MEMNTQTKSFLLFLTPCLAFFICQFPSYLTAFESWEQVLPAPPANSVMIAGASQAGGSYPNFVRTKEGQYYRLIDSSRNNKKWILVKNVDKKSRDNLLESEYKLSNPLIPFLFNRPRGTIIDHFYTEQVQLRGNYPPPLNRVYYVLLDGGTLWSWSDPLLINQRKAFNQIGVIYAVIVFIVTGVTLLVMNRVGKPLPFKKPNQLFRLICRCLIIGFLIGMPAYCFIFARSSM